VLQNQGRVFRREVQAGWIPSVLPGARLAPDEPIGHDREHLRPRWRRLQEAILGECDPTRLVATAEEFLRQRSPARDPMAETIARIVADIASDRTITTVDAIVRRCEFTTRSLQRLFAQYVGVSPKWVIKRYRCTRSWSGSRAARRSTGPSSRCSLGYFDQAHFIKDFKSIVGRTPGEYVKRLERALQ